MKEPRMKFINVPIYQPSTVGDNYYRKKISFESMNQFHQMRKFLSFEVRNWNSCQTLLTIELNLLCFYKKTDNIQ